jgi:hypothetical protein
MLRKDRQHKLDALTEAQRGLLYAKSQGLDEQPVHTIAALVKWLDAEFAITISASALSTWLARRRSEHLFADRLERIRAASARAERMAGEVSRRAEMTNASVTMLSAALQDALLDEDTASAKSSAKLLASLLEATAKEKAAEAAIASSKLAAQKFQFDAAKAALKHAESLQQVAKSSATDREKLQQGVRILFGEKAAHIQTAADFLGEEEAQ